MPGTTWANEMKFVMNDTCGAGLIGHIITSHFHTQILLPPRCWRTKWEQRDDLPGHFWTFCSLPSKTFYQVTGRFGYALLSCQTYKQREHRITTNINVVRWHESALDGYAGPWVTWANDMNFGMNYAPDAGRITYCWSAVQCATTILRLPPWT